MNVEALLAAVPGAVADEGFGPLGVDVPAGSWPTAVRVARDELGCRFFDFLTAVDEPEGIRLVCHVVSLRSALEHVVLRTLLDRERPSVASVADLYAGAAWHERETAEMFGVTFVSGTGQPLALGGLLLPPGFEGHPLRKDFALAARLDRPWPGDSEVGS